MKKLFKIGVLISLLICLVMVLTTMNVYADNEFTVSYDDDGDTETVNVTVNLAEDSVIKKVFDDGETQDEIVTLIDDLEIGNPTRANYKFTGWSVEEDNDYALVLKANWEIKKYTVTFNSNTGETNQETQTQDFNFGEEKKLTKNTFENAGCVFVKWTTNPDGTGTEYDDEALVSDLVNEDNGNLNLYAQWRQLQNYEVSYDDDGNERTNNVVKTIVEGSKVKKIFNNGSQAEEIVVSENVPIENPTKQDHIFIGWSEVQDDDYALVLQANWKTQQYTVTFYSNTENESTFVQTFDFGVSRKLTKNTFQKEHYIFLNWNTKRDGTGTSYTDEQLITNNLVTQDGGNFDLYAQWKKDEIYRETIQATNGENITQKLVDAFNESQNSYYKQSIITIPSGTFWVGDNNNLVIHSNTQLVLQSNTELKKVANTQNSIIRTRASENAKNITITGGTFNCNSSSVNGIEIASAQNVTISNVKLINAGNNRNGISISNSKNVNLDKVETGNNKKAGIYISNSTGKITNSKSYSNTTNGVMLVDKSNVTIDNLTAYSNKQNGLYVNNSTSNVSNNTLYQNSEQGLYINNSTVPVKNTKTYSNTQNGVMVVTNSNVTIDNLMSYSNKQNGLYIKDSKGTVINTTTHNNKVGVYINNSNISRFEKNSAYDNSDSGMFITNNSNRVTMQNVNVYGNKGHGVEASASIVTINNSDIYNNTQNGIFINQKSKVTMNVNEVHENKKTGISIANSSTGYLRNSLIYSNSEYGIYVNDSLLKANDGANNKIYSNNYNGVSATGAETEVFLHKNEIYDNGKAGKSSSDGEIGHGVGVAEGAYANVTNNKIYNNKQCGVSIFDKARAKINKNTITGNGRHGVGARQNIKIYVMKENKISNNAYNGFLLADKSNGNTLTNNTITDNGQYGISVVDKSTVTLSKTTITNNVKSNLSISKGDANRTGSKVIFTDANYIASSKKEHGIVLSGGAILEITKKDNKIENNNKNGISLTDGSTLKISASTTVYGNGENGIFIKNSEAQIKKAKIKKNTKYGVHLENSGYLNIWSSSILNNKNYGINVSGEGAVAKISKNTIESNKNIGIAIKNGATATEIKKNKITNHSKYGIGIYNSNVNKNSGNTYSGNGKNVYKQ